VLLINVGKKNQKVIGFSGIAKDGKRSFLLFFPNHKERNAAIGENGTRKMHLSFAPDIRTCVSGGRP